MPPGHITLKYTVIGSRAFAASACWPAAGGGVSRPTHKGGI